MKERFDLEGMTCAACSLAVEKAVKKIEGVENVNVSLLTNSMNVDMTDKIDPSKIIDAVQKAGYEAKLKRQDAKVQRVSPRDIINKEIKDLKNRLLVSIPLMILLMYVAMGEMLALPYPTLFQGVSGAGLMIFSQLLLTLPILYVNRAYFINGFKALFSGNPNMDTLVALGSAAGVIYGLFSTYMILYGLGTGNDQMVGHYRHDIYYESAAMILTLITLGKYFEAKSKAKTTDAINKLIDIQPDYVTLIKDGLEAKVPVEDIVIGDQIKIIPGERIAIDGVIISGHSSLDQQAITGESIPVEVKAGDNAISGSVNMNGSFIMEAKKVGEDTTIQKIIQLMEEASASKAPISKMADKISGIFVPIVIVLSIVSFIVWLWLGYGFEFAFSIGVGVLVISCPCALGLATPVAMMVATGKAADSGVIIKSAEALEVLHDVDVMIFDKTGTITKGQPVITDIVLVDDANKDEVLSIAYSLENNSQQPLAFAIIAKAKERQARLRQVTNFESFTGKGVKADIGDERYYIGNAKLLKDIGVYNEEAEKASLKFSKEGKTSVFLFSDKKILAILAIADQIKESSVEAIKEISKLGIKTVMLTGDHELTAKAMADKSGVDEFKAELMPQDKDRIVSAYQEDGSIVAMVGDGVNDAPALVRADVGLAIAAGTDVAVDSADMVLMKSDLQDVVNAIRLSQKTIKNIKQNLFWAFLYNVLAIPIAMGIFYIPFGLRLNPMIGALAMSLSSIFVVSNALRLRRFEAVNLHFGKDNENIDQENYQHLILGDKIKLVDITERRGMEDMKKTFIVEGMTCEHCKMRVEKAVSQLDSVHSVEVVLDEGLVRLEGDRIDDQQVKNAIEDAGYTVIGEE